MTRNIKRAARVDRKQKPCTICGRGKSRSLVVRLRRGALMPCLADANDLHHDRCSDACDGCVASFRLGRRA